MYCIRCGVKLADTESKCPLCGTVVCHPDFGATAPPLYPPNRLPEHKDSRKALSGAVIILFLLPLIICFFADRQINGHLDWFGYVAGAVVTAYVLFALPYWFRKPNPVIFTPCGFAAAAVYLLYICLATGGNWFLTFALPVLAGLCLITCTVVTLMHYLKRGKLYILGGAMMGLGAFMPLVEWLMNHTFALSYIGWSVYPLMGFCLFGGLFIYFAIHRSARAIMARKLFF